jgi:hypothetical protein
MKKLVFTNMRTHSKVIIKKYHSIPSAKVQAMKTLAKRGENVEPNDLILKIID